MGVPGFFKWLTERYPLAVVDVIEEEEEEVGDDKPANPNKMEFDNLYLDLNGIISPASSLPGDDLFQNMFDYIDRIFGIVRPRKLLYMALDGVAPMAKTDQQRSRRFMSAIEASEKEMEDERLVNEFEKAGKKLFPRQNSKVTVVTVGSVFIVQMIAALEYYIHLRLNNDPRWKSIKVILSDAYAPGEAEHKIMSYIRLQRNLPGYDANTRHCMYGLDADLIMLALVSHEVHFSILREKDNCFLCGQTGHSGVACEKNEKSNEDDEGVTEAKQPYQFLNIWTLREYLDYEFWIPNPPFEIDFERILDDFVFMCFFLGNDFLPQMPTLVTREGAINLMINVYRKEFPTMGGYLTESGKPNLSQIEHFIQAVGSYEDKIFRKRAISYQRRADRSRNEKAQAKEEEDAEPQLKSESVMKQNEAGQAIEGFVLDIQSKQSETPMEKEIYMQAQKISKGSFGATIEAANDEDRISLIVKMIENEYELDEKLCDLLQEKWDPFNPVNLEANKVKLGESGWKERYYKEKFSANSPAEIEAIQKDVVRRYTEGLCWLLRYYYEGLCSWQWFYPYHYAPFASDLKDLGPLKISFELGVPWKPLDQLMGVLPVASSHALPEHYRKLMTDPDSPIIDFYPTDFEVDTEGKWYRNQGVVKIPFIDEGRLLAETRKVEHTLTEEEVVRNIVTVDVIFVARSHPLSSSIVSVHDQFIQLLEKDPSDIKERLDPKASDGMNGYLSPFCGDHCPPIVKSPFNEMEDITNNQVMCAIYRLPDEHKHITRPSAGVIFPKKTVTERDLKPPPFPWYEDTRKKPWERRQYFTNMSHHDSSRPRPSLFPGEKEMQNPPTNSAHPQLGEVARQFIVQSMQQVEKEHIGMNQMHKPPFNAAGTSNASPHSNVEYHNQDVHLRPVPPGVDSRAYNSKLVNNTNNPFQNRSVHGYSDPDASSSSAAHRSPRYARNDWRATRRSDDPNPMSLDGHRPGLLHFQNRSTHGYRDPDASSSSVAHFSPQDERNDWRATHSSDDPNPMSLDGHRPGLLHNARSQYPPRNRENTPIASRADSHPRGGYNDHGRYSQTHRASDHHQRGGTRDQATSPNDLGRGYGHSQQLGNQRHSDLDKNATRRPYQPPHMRDRY